MQGVRLATFTAQLQWHEVPAAIRAKVVDHVVDILGVMFAGAAEDVCVRARKAASQWGQGSESLVVGAPQRASAPSAAFVNALQGRIRTYDDVHELATLHAGSPIIAASLAMAEREAASGRQFLLAALCGYEVATRVAASISPAHHVAGFHSTGTCSPLGTAASASKLLGLDAETTATTMGLAGETGAGLRQYQVDGSMLDSAFHGARAAQSGIMVAQMGQAGLAGPKAIIEGRWGLCRSLSPEFDPDVLDRNLGDQYEFANVSQKPYASCRFTHGPIHAALQLHREHGFAPADVAEIEIGTFRQSIEVSDRPKLVSDLDPTFSHQYAIAVALLRGRVDLEDVRFADRDDSALMSLMAKVRVVHDEAVQQAFPASWSDRVTITMSDGRRFAAFSSNPPGHRDSPLAQEIIDAKFLRNTAACLPGDNGRQALQAIRHVEDCKDVRELTRLLAVSAHAVPQPAFSQ